MLGPAWSSHARRHCWHSGCPPKHLKHHSSANRCILKGRGCILCRPTPSPFVWDSSIHTSCPGIISTGSPLHSQRPGWGSKLAALGLDQLYASLACLEDSIPGRQKAGHLLSTLQISSSFRWSPLAPLNDASNTLQSSWWSFLMALSRLWQWPAPQGARSTECPGVLWRDGQDYAVHLGWADVKKKWREKKRERKEANYQSHLWKPFL